MSGHVGFVVDKVALEQVFSKYFGIPCQSSFHRLLHIHHVSSRAGTVGQLVADIPSGLDLTPPQETKRKTKLVFVLNAFEDASSDIDIITKLLACRVLRSGM
jgi:hypothetical protein